MFRIKHQFRFDFFFLSVLIIVFFFFWFFVVVLFEFFRLLVNRVGRCVTHTHTHTHTRAQILRKKNTVDFFF